MYLAKYSPADFASQQQSPPHDPGALQIGNGRAATSCRRLDSREAQVVKLVALSKISKEIGFELGISREDGRIPQGQRAQEASCAFSRGLIRACA
jgi:FixJ family two-component response regulator